MQLSLALAKVALELAIRPALAALGLPAVQWLIELNGSFPILRMQTPDPQPTVT